MLIEINSFQATQQFETLYDMCSKMNCIILLEGRLIGYEVI